MESTPLQSPIVSTCRHSFVLPSKSQPDFIDMGADLHTGPSRRRGRSREGGGTFREELAAAKEVEVGEGGAKEGVAQVEEAAALSGGQVGEAGAGHLQLPETATAADPEFPQLRSRYIDATQLPAVCSSPQISAFSLGS